MKAIEFTTNIKNGIIRLPIKYKKIADSVVRIILLADEKERKSISKKEKLEKLFVEATKKNIFKSIENPIEWQKKLRNEWE